MQLYEFNLSKPSLTLGTMQIVDQEYKVRVKNVVDGVGWHINNEIYIQKTSLRGESLLFINFCLIAHETFVLNFLS